MPILIKLPNKEQGKQVAIILDQVLDSFSFDGDQLDWDKPVRSIIKQLEKQGVKTE